jgi:hypothetical protein
MYQCNFGLKDYYHDTLHQKSKKRGCNPKFSMKRLLKYPNVVEIQWSNMDHTCEDGTPTHGTLDSDLILCTSFQVPHVSKHIKEWVEERLYRGFHHKTNL